MKVKVTQKNIDEAVHHNPECCPIALAMKGIVNDESAYVVVDGECVWVHDPIRKRYELPELAQEFVINFDSGRLVRPMEFEIDER